MVYGTYAKCKKRCKYNRAINVSLLFAVLIFAWFLLCTTLAAQSSLKSFVFSWFLVGYAILWKIWVASRDVTRSSTHNPGCSCTPVILGCHNGSLGPLGSWCVFCSYSKLSHEPRLVKIAYRIWDGHFGSLVLPHLPSPGLFVSLACSIIKMIYLQGMDCFFIYFPHT